MDWDSRFEEFLCGVKYKAYRAWGSLNLGKKVVFLEKGNFCRVVIINGYKCLRFDFFNMDVEKIKELKSLIKEFCINEGYDLMAI